MGFKREMKAHGLRLTLIAVAATAVVGILYLRAGSFDRVSAGTLNPADFTGMAHDAYAVAAKYPRLLEQLHCYCGCETEGAHKNLLDCYRSTHASHCQICMHEALDAVSMYKDGDPVKQIRETLRAMYKRAG